MKKIPSIIENKTVYSFQQKYPNINQKPTIEIFSGLLRRQGNAIFLSENDRVVKYGKEYWLAQIRIKNLTAFIYENFNGDFDKFSERLGCDKEKCSHDFFDLNNIDNSRANYRNLEQKLGLKSGKLDEDFEFEGIWKELSSNKEPSK